VILDCACVGISSVIYLFYVYLVLNKSVCSSNNFSWMFEITLDIFYHLIIRPVCQRFSLITTILFTLTYLDVYSDETTLCEPVVSIFVN
jgi:hypothetical protein